MVVPPREAAEKRDGKPVLELDGVQVSFGSGKDGFPVVNGVSLTLEAGKTLGIVGESGCGKSILSLSILRLLPSGAAITGGDIRLSGNSIARLPERDIRKLRGNEISMIFQEPMTALNPVFTVGRQLSEVFETHQGLDRKEARSKAIEILGAVGVPSPEMRIDNYPSQLSGGMRQRVMIAMALACRPKVLIADEPTTALDVTIQAQILELIRALQTKFGTAVIFISHDLGVIAEVSDRIAVLYGGKVVEEADTEDLFSNPRHPYTQGLMRAVPQPDADELPEELFEIPGTVPSPAEKVSGCRFHPRCSVARDICREREPDTLEVAPRHFVACWEARDV